MNKIILITFISIIMTVLYIYLPINLYWETDGSSSNWGNLIEVNETMFKEEERLKNLSVDERKRIIDILKSQAEMRALKSRIVQYSSDYNENLEKLDDLLATTEEYGKYWKDRENILDLWGNLYEFEIEGDTPRHINEIKVISCGSDGKKNTDDDIVSVYIVNGEKYDLNTTEKNIKNIAPFGLTITSIKKDNNILKVSGVVWAPILKIYGPQAEMFNSLSEFESILLVHSIHSDTYIDGYRFLTVCSTETQPLREFSSKLQQPESGTIIKVDDDMLKEEKSFYSLSDNELNEKRETIENYKELNRLKNLLLKYANDYKRYPEYLEELVVNNYVHDSSIKDPWGNLYVISVIYDSNGVSQKIIITSKGQDQNKDTEDDIVFNYNVLPDVIDLNTLEREIRSFPLYGLKITSIERKDNILNAYGYTWDDSLINNLMRELLFHSIRCNAYIKSDCNAQFSPQKFKLICSSEELPEIEKGIVEGGHWVSGKDIKDSMSIDKLKKINLIDKETIVAEVTKTLPDELKDVAQIKVGINRASVSIKIPDENDLVKLSFSITDNFKSTPHLQNATCVMGRNYKIRQSRMFETEIEYTYPENIIVSNLTLRTQAISEDKISADIKNMFSSGFYQIRCFADREENYFFVDITSEYPDVSLKKLHKQIEAIKTLDYIKAINLVDGKIRLTKGNKLNANLHCFLQDRYYILKMKDIPKEYDLKYKESNKKDFISEVPKHEIPKKEIPEKIITKQIEINPEGGFITVNVENLDIHELFVELGKKAKQSIFIEGNIDGEVNINVKQDTFENIIKEVQKTNNFIYEIEDNIIFISKNKIPFPYEKEIWKSEKGKKEIELGHKKASIDLLKTSFEENLGIIVFKYNTLPKLKTSYFANRMSLDHFLYCILRVCGLQYKIEDNIVIIWPYGEEKPVIDKKDIILPYEGCSAPDFTIKTIDGNTITLSEQKGKIAILYFWYPSEKYCYPGLEILNEIYNKYPAEKIHIIGIFSDKKIDNSEKLKTKWPQYADENLHGNKLKDIYKIYSMRFVILIDQKGIIRYRNSEIKNLDQLVDNVINQQ